MKILITGGSGFVGTHLVNHLIECGDEAIITKLPGERSPDQCKSYDLDLRNVDGVGLVLEAAHPDAIIHLAAQSSVALSWERPAFTAEINIIGTVNLLEALRASDLSPRVLLIGSSEEYGDLRRSEMPVCEDAVANPQNPYSITKLTQTLFGLSYSYSYGLDIVSTRSFNHFGPGQNEGFVVSAFCKQVASIEKGIQPNKIRVGNLTAQRDFTDVRDVVRAYRSLLSSGKTGEIYNVGSGIPRPIQSILDEVLQLANVEIIVETDASKFRPVDTPVIFADISKIKRDTDWEPEIPLHTTIRNTLDYWREKLIY